MFYDKKKIYHIISNILYTVKGNLHTTSACRTSQNQIPTPANSKISKCFKLLILISIAIAKNEILN